MAFCKNCGTEIPEGTKFCPNCGAPTGDGQTNSVITDRAGGTGGTYETGQPISDSGQASYQQGQPVSNNGQSSVQQGQPVSNNGQSSVQQGQPVSDNRQPSFQKGQYQQIGPGYVKDVPASGINKYGKFFGIALFILSLAVFLTDPPFIRIILSAAIIAGAVFCISRKYKLKGFSIAAIVFAVLCLFGGVSQAKNYGMFTTPRVDSTAAGAGEGKSADHNASGQQEKTPAPTAAQSSPGTDASAQGSGKEGAASKDTSQAAATSDTPAESKAAENTEGAEQAPGVDPELKAFLDSYEKFIDEYVAFMKTYNSDPANAVSMLAEYSRIMGTYAEFTEKLAQYDENEMSAADAAYYLEVTTRCTQKMLELLSAS